MNVMPVTDTGGRERAIDALRVLAMDMVEEAGCGHPGAPMGLAEAASVLWRRHIRHNPKDPHWPDRDRFVLSNGHASALLYALLHLSGYDLPLSELKRFRRFGSKTPGHPEFGATPGVETTTGPLGQGLANAVGMAIAERALAAQFNRPDHTIVDHRTFVIVGDGCLMEGISHEAASLAGTLKLGKLIALYDDNGISIDGKVEEWFADDTPGRFEAYGWDVIRAVDGHDPMAINAALKAAVANQERPTLICCRTTIGFGAPSKAGHQDTHGAPLGAEEAARVRMALGWHHAPFELPQGIYDDWDGTAKGAAAQAEWQSRFARYALAYPDLAAEFSRRVAGDLPADFAAVTDTLIAAAVEKGESVATRKASQNALAALAGSLPELIGGSADLAHSNLTWHKGSRPVTRDPGGNAIFFGVREFAMAAIANGLALHGGFVPYVATFLVFSDYARNAIRMSALMGLRVIYVLTHDSIGLGEDGPTHQPVEQMESLRLIPNLDVWRPCDAVETAMAWSAALARKNGPTALILSRQTLPHQPRSGEACRDISRGGYVLSDPVRAPEAVILATGSEVALARAAKETLAAEKIVVRLVSLPCVEVFERQEARWRDTVLPPYLPVVVVEAGASRGWGFYAADRRAVIGLDRFGESGSAVALFPHFGFTSERVAEIARGMIADSIVD
jgi:transketolase